MVGGVAGFGGETGAGGVSGLAGADTAGVTTEGMAGKTGAAVDAGSVGVASRVTCAGVAGAAGIPVEALNGAGTVGDSAVPNSFSMAFDAATANPKMGFPSNWASTGLIFCAPDWAASAAAATAGGP